MIHVLSLFWNWYTVHVCFHAAIWEYLWLLALIMPYTIFITWIVKTFAICDCAASNVSRSMCTGVWCGPFHTHLDWAVDYKQYLHLYQAYGKGRTVWHTEGRLSYFLHRQIFPIRIFFFSGRARNKLDKARKQFFHLQGQMLLSQLLGQIFFSQCSGRVFVNLSRPEYYILLW